MLMLSCTSDAVQIRGPMQYSHAVANALSVLGMVVLA